MARDVNDSIFNLKYVLRVSVQSSTTNKSVEMRKIPAIEEHNSRPMRGNRYRSLSLRRDRRGLCEKNFRR